MPSRHGKYPTQEEYEAALEDGIQRVRAGASQKSTAALLGLSRTTLARRIQGHQTLADKTEASMKLSRSQETELIGWTHASEASGITASHSKVRQLATRLQAASGADARAGKNWVGRFIKRHKDVIHSMSPSPIEQARIDGAKRHVIAPWFERLQRLIDTFGIVPANIWNMDETGLQEDENTIQRVI